MFHHKTEQQIDRHKMLLPVVFVNIVVLIVFSFIVLNSNTSLIDINKDQVAQVVSSQPVVGYTTLGPSRTINTTSTPWQISDVGNSVNPNAIMELAIPFVITQSGKINFISIIIGRPSTSQSSETLRPISLAVDSDGKPGTKLESWNILPSTSPAVVILTSVVGPDVSSGTKYWLIVEANPSGTAEDHLFVNNLGIESNIQFRTSITSNFESVSGLLPSFDVKVIPSDTELVTNDTPITVNAGTDQTITLPDTVNLIGTATPNSEKPLTYTWKKIDGPGTVTFVSLNALNTVTSFSEAGTYQLSLEVYDGALTFSDTISVTVNPEIKKSLVALSGPDSDGDGLIDDFENAIGSNPGVFSESYANGIPQVLYLRTLGNPPLADQDKDGMPDVWETKYGLGPSNVSDAGNDNDNDGSINFYECLFGTDPTKADSDGDGAIDSIDRFPNDSSESADSDGDNIGDNKDLDDDNDDVSDSSDSDPKAVDPDRDGLMNWEEINTKLSGEYRTNPNKSDSDDDGLIDGIDELPNDPRNSSGVVQKDNADPLNVANERPGRVIFVNPYSPNWTVPTTPRTASEMRTKALNPLTPAPSLSDLMAVGAFQQGDMVVLRKGIHFFNILKAPTIQKLGTESEPFIIKSYPNERAVLEEMVISRGWEDGGVINGNQVYSKNFFSPSSFYFFLYNKTPLIGFSGSWWRIFDTTVKPFGSVGAYVSDKTFFPSVPGGTTSKITISLPGGQNPDTSGGIMRAGTWTTFDFRSTDRMVYYVLDNISINNSSFGMKINSNINITIRNSSFTNIADIGIFFGKTNNIVQIYDSYFENIGATVWGQAIYAAGHNSIIARNKFSDVGGAAVGISGYDHESNNKVYSNLIGPGKGNVFPYGNYGIGISDFGDNNFIYNNIIWGAHKVAISINNLGSQILNNTVVGSDRSVGVIGLKNTGTIIKNNIFVQDGTTNANSSFVTDLNMRSASESAIFDNNIFFSKSGRYAFNLYPPNQSRAKTVDEKEYKEIMKNANNSEVSSFFGDPKFVDINANNFRLKADSPAINRGINNNNSIYDFDGVKRVSLPDLGTYEYFDMNTLSFVQPDDPTIPDPDPLIPISTPDPLLPIINGLCGSTLNACREGVFRDTEDSASQHRWMCLGSNSGLNGNCSLDRFLPPAATNISRNIPSLPTNTGYRRTGTNVVVPNINIPNTVIDIQVPHIPSWLNVITTLFDGVVDNIVRGYNKTKGVILERI